MSSRCAAAHHDDPRPCEEPRDAVIIKVGSTDVSACVLHGAAMLASIKGSRVYPGSSDGAAIEAFKRAQTVQPFDFMA